MKEKRIKTKIIVLIISLCTSMYLFTTVSTTQWYSNKDKANKSIFEGTLVMEDLHINYLYDKSRYEIVNLSQKPYAVLSGSKDLLNIVKWSNKQPEFTVDLRGKKEGTYRVPITYRGIDKRLKVDLYSEFLNIRVREQQTVKLKPVIDIIGQDDIPKGYSVKQPILSQEEISIRDTQAKLNRLVQIKGVLDISSFRQTTKVRVYLKPYDSNGKLIKNINLLEDFIYVEVPIENSKLIIEKPVIKEKVVEKIVEKPKYIVKEVNKVVEKPKKPTDDKENTGVEKPQKQENDNNLDSNKKPETENENDGKEEQQDNTQENKQEEK